MSKPRISREAYLRVLKGDLPLTELRRDYPDLWEETLTWMAENIGQSRNPATWRAPLKQLQDRTAAWLQRAEKSGYEPHTLSQAFPHLVRLHMTRQALESYCLQVLNPPQNGVIRFRFWNGFILQKLLFRRGFERKPVSMRAFRFWWPLIGQQSLLMLFAQKQGIYCFYSRQLIQRLKALIGDLSCVEIAAGDGTLARFLTAAGTPVRATDNGAWEGIVNYPAEVERLDAREALATYRPQAVLCSWPPPCNHFEAAVFETPSVSLYIVIGSRHEYATGNWQVYARASQFTREPHPELAALVLPPDQANEVFVFRRRREAGDR